MSRSFDGTDDSLSAVGAAVTAVPLTMACWFFSTSNALTQRLMMLDNNADTNRFMLDINGAGAGDPFRAAATAAGTTNIADTVSGYSPNVWQHGCGVFVGNSERHAYINGGGKGSSLTARTPTGITHTRIGRSQSGSSPMAGMIAEAAIWDVALSDAEVAELAGGKSPFNVQGASLVAYWPLSGFQSPEEDFDGSIDLTINGASVSVHPPVEASPVTAKQLGAL